MANCSFFPFGINRATQNSYPIQQNGNMVQLRTAPAIDFVLEKYQDEFMGKVHSDHSLQFLETVKFDRQGQGCEP